MAFLKKQSYLGQETFKGSHPPHSSHRVAAGILPAMTDQPRERQDEKFFFSSKAVFFLSASFKGAQHLPGPPFVFSSNALIVTHVLSDLTCRCPRLFLRDSSVMGRTVVQVILAQLYVGQGRNASLVFAEFCLGITFSHPSSRMEQFVSRQPYYHPTIRLDFPAQSKLKATLLSSCVILSEHESE